MHNQNDAPPLHVVHSRYEDLINHYITDFSDIFFHTNKSEEWFQERYHPCRLAQIEKDAETWATSSSKELLESLIKAPSHIVNACNLDPPDWLYADRGIKKQKVTEKATDSSTNDAVEVIDESKDVNDNDSKKNDDVIVNTDGMINYGRHIPGHEDRAIFISNIHANCPKSVLKNVINEALTAAELPLPERIIIAQPAWTTKLPPRFLKAGWVFMPTADSTRKAVKVLRDMEVIVPGVPEPEQLDTKVGILYKFILHAIIHDSNRQRNVIKAFYSHVERVRMDTIKAKELADLLDELKGVPEATRLNTILDENHYPDIAEAFVKVTDKLDLIIAYLRRVHFVSFYSAKRYMDEAHMMTLTPSVFYRKSVPRESTSTSTTTANEPEVDDDTEKTDKKRKREDDEEDGEEIEEGEEKEDGKKEENEKKRFIDHRIEQMITDLKKLTDRKKALAESPELERTKDESDPIELDTKLEKVYNDLAHKSCTVEKDGRARCLYKLCNKLFKSMEFLTKHLKSKHEYFGYAKLVSEAEPYMRAKYDAEDINWRPLPLVEVDNMGIIEKHSVREITSMIGVAKQMHQPPLPPLPPIERRWSGEMPPPLPRRTSYPPRTEGGNKMAQFMDVDAPKVIITVVVVIVVVVRVGVVRVVGVRVVGVRVVGVRVVGVVVIHNSVRDYGVQLP